MEITVLLIVLGFWLVFNGSRRIGVQGIAAVHSRAQGCGTSLILLLTLAVLLALSL